MTEAASFNYDSLLSKVGKSYALFIERGLKQLPSLDFKNTTFHQMDEGMSATTLFYFEHQGKKYVMRVFPQKYEIDKRLSEIEAHKVAAEMGIAPRLYYVGPESFVIIMEYVDAQPLTRKDLNKKEVLENFARVLKKLHEYKIPFSYRRTQKSRIVSHKERLTQKGVAVPSSYEGLYQKYLKESDQQEEKDQVLTHGDLNSSNILLDKNGKIYLVDWAGASRENRYVDLGGFTFWNGLTPTQTDIFMKAYLGKNLTEEEKKNLLMGQKRAAFLVATIWLHFAPNPEDDRPLSKRVKELDEWMLSSLRKAKDYIKAEDVVPLKIPNNYAQRAAYALAFLKAYRDDWL